MSSVNKSYHTQTIKQEALRLGFDYCGISKADFLEEEAPRLEKWLKEGRHGGMKYMENHLDKRLDPRLLVEGAQSVVSLLYNYYPSQKQNPEAPKIAKYAYGQDYHPIIKSKLEQLLANIREKIGDIQGRGFVDSAPIMDKAWAAKGGLGWRGKNTILINPTKGSFFFVAELVVDMELDYDNPIKDYCGTCAICIDACPTDAIKPYMLDATKCISNLTIELKEDIPTALLSKTENWIFGCDICQDVCPWNRFAVPHKEPLFNPLPKLLDMKKSDWETISEEVFNNRFAKSSLKRASYKGIKRNISTIL